ncbi:ester cyclase [Nocardiopsis halophila]|uniref:ester cyclase n=1 Tax=Nocardiopsis halophila TaxID=141692 RepID=UPI000348D1C4|nr:ester cyclase [Nocardiopsis halophila]
MTSIDPREICRIQFDAMRAGGLDAFTDHVHPHATNREARSEPLACRAEGPEAFLATALMLRSAFADLDWDVHDVVVEGELVVGHATMRARQTGVFHDYDAEGRVAAAFPPTGKRCAVTQTHWWRMADGLMVEHWANRDDLGMAQQLGWVPPRPFYLASMALAMRRARRAEARNGGPIPEGLNTAAES